MNETATLKDIQKKLTSIEQKLQDSENKLTDLHRFVPFIEWLYNMARNFPRNRFIVLSEPPKLKDQ